MMKNKNALREHRNECVPQKGSGIMINEKKKVKFAVDIVKEILRKGSIKIPKGNVSGEEFGKWLREERKCHDNK